MEKGYYKYIIEYRIYQDVHWFGGWFRGMIPKWGEWKVYTSYTKLENAGNVFKILEAKKHLDKFRKEYRIRINE